MRGGAPLLALLMAVVGCVDESTAEDGRYSLMVDTTAPASVDATGELRVRVEPSAGWKLSQEAPVRLTLDETEGLTFAAPEQRSGDAVSHTEKALEFATDYRVSTPERRQASGLVKFGICQSEDRCAIVRHPLHVELGVAARP